MSIIFLGSVRTRPGRHERPPCRLSHQVGSGSCHSHRFEGLGRGPEQRYNRKESQELSDRREEIDAEGRKVVSRSFTSTLDSRPFSSSPGLVTLLHSIEDLDASARERHLGKPGTGDTDSTLFAFAPFLRISIDLVIKLDGFSSYATERRLLLLVE